MPPLSSGLLRLQLLLLLLRILDRSQECSATPQELPCQAHEELLALLDCCLDRCDYIHCLCWHCKPTRPAGGVAHKPHLQPQRPSVGCKFISVACVRISAM